MPHRPVAGSVVTKEEAYYADLEARIAGQEMRASMQDRENEKRFYEFTQRQDKFEKAVYGNGRPGVLERVTALERALATQTWLLRLVVGAVLAWVVSERLHLV